MSQSQENLQTHTEGWTDRWTDPIFWDPSGQGQGSYKNTEY